MTPQKVLDILNENHEVTDFCRAMSNACNLELSSLSPAIENEGWVRKGVEYILCAAIWYDDGKEYPHQPVNIKEGYVWCGRRHHNIINLRGRLLNPDKSIEPRWHF